MEDDRKNSFSLVFDSRELEAAYREYAFPQMRGMMRMALVVAAILYLAFGFLDAWVVAEVKEKVWIIRILVTAFFALLYVATFARFFKKVILAAMTSFTFVAGTGILIMLLLADDAGAQLYYAGLILVIIGSLLMLGSPFVHGLMGCLYILVAYEVIAIARDTPLPILVSNTFFLASSLIIAAFTAYSLELHVRRGFYQTRIIEKERAKSESLLLNILPEDTAKVLKERNGTIADYFDEVSILFADMVGFTPLTEQMTPTAMVELLNELFCYFDSLVEKYHLEKIRTIGDSYMVTSGVPRPRSDHAQALARMALDMRDFAASSVRLPYGRLQLRIGINSGPVMAGVIGKKKFQYDVWGSAVNIASRMESQGIVGKIQVSQATYELLADEFICEQRGTVMVKGIGTMETWFLVDRKRFEAPRAQRASARADGAGRVPVAILT